MTPLQFETMIVHVYDIPKRLRLQRSHDIIWSGVFCWPMKYYMKDSPFAPCDYSFQTIGLDGVQ